MNFVYTYFDGDMIYESVSCPDCEWKQGPLLMSHASDLVNAADRHRESTGHSPEDEINVRITPGPKDPDYDSEPELTLDQLHQIRHLWESVAEDDDDDEED